MGQSCDLYIFMCIVTAKFHYHQLSIMNPNYFLFREQFWLCFSPPPPHTQGQGEVVLFGLLDDSWDGSIGNKRPKLGG